MSPISVLKVLKHEITTRQNYAGWQRMINTVMTCTPFIISVITTDFNVHNRFLCMLSVFLYTVYSAKEHLIKCIAAKD